MLSVKKMVDFLDLNLLSPQDVEDGNLHVAYNYAYAESLEMRSDDGGEIKAKLSGGKIEDVYEVGAKADMKVKKADELIFKRKGGVRIAFAYKCGRLIRSKGSFLLHAGDVKHFTGSMTGGYVPFPGVSVTIEERDIDTV
ncbi:MAG: hypothetical protein VST70_02470 [Nitrospirota bacterium]|nr:hypothetical protein [Nitrospirota bacterium]